MSIFKVGSTLMNIAGSNNTIILINGVVADKNTPANEGDTITFKIEDGIDLIYSPTVYFVNGKVDTSGVKIYTSGTPITPGLNIYPIVSDDGKTADHIFDSTNIGGFARLKIITELAPPDVSGDAPFNNVYSIDLDKFKALNGVRFQASSDGVVDYGKYITSVLSVPFNLPDDLMLGDDVIAGDANVILGDLTTTLNTEILNTDSIVYNLGTISVRSVHHNMLDYLNTDANLHLPYAPMQTLAMEYVVDCDIQITYTLNVYTGDAVVNVDSTNIGTSVVTNVSSTELKLGVDIPYIDGEYFGSIKNDSYDVGSDNGVRKAYVELVSSTNTLVDGFFTAPVLDEKPLSGTTGYVVVEKINLSVRTVRDDKQEIISLLSQGVIIKS